MEYDFIANAKSQLVKCLNDIYDKEFIIQFNGEFLIAISKCDIDDELSNIPSCINGYTFKNNRFYLTLSNKYLKDSVSFLNSSTFSKKSISIFSQITRLRYQIENSLFGGSWNDDMYQMAKDILYLIHTNSSSIRTNIVKRCARRYNNLQIKGDIPFELINGYKSALCMISYDYGE